MMKKTLLSIMTLAALVSSATATAETKDIIVSAEIPSVITVQKSIGGDIDSIKLASVPGSASEYEAKEKITFRNGGTSVKVGVRSDLALVSQDDVSRSFEELVVTLDGHAMSAAMLMPIAFDDSKDVELLIKGKSPAGAKVGETYAGKLELTLEPDA